MDGADDGPNRIYLAFAILAVIGAGEGEKPGKSELGRVIEGVRHHLAAGCSFSHLIYSQVEVIANCLKLLFEDLHARVPRV